MLAESEPEAFAMVTAFRKRISYYDFEGAQLALSFVADEVEAGALEAELRSAMETAKATEI